MYQEIHYLHYYLLRLNHRKCTDGYKLTKSQEKINHLMYMNDAKLFANNEKELETSSKNIQSGHGDEI